MEIASFMLIKSSNSIFTVPQSESFFYYITFNSFHFCRFFHSGASNSDHSSVTSASSCASLADTAKYPLHSASSRTVRPSRFSLLKAIWAPPADTNPVVVAPTLQLFRPTHACPNSRGKYSHSSQPFPMRLHVSHACSSGKLSVSQSVVGHWAAEPTPAYIKHFITPLRVTPSIVWSGQVAVANCGVLVVVAGSSAVAQGVRLVASSFNIWNDTSSVSQIYE